MLDGNGTEMRASEKESQNQNENENEDTTVELTRFDSHRR
ncbi:MAG: hypothetical protein J07HQW2_00162 [Haloquadratum walsbyi J07HQW2]|uniref:Uncharacterized protein n=1 Tax=Haloquadratum walsbyi J07HQW2 TaxID=1238425 RepID=U1MTV6_9EURY|nr:MAG: hypothetical protein J07HQW2_00162 [Haloquadratum walsbyi J07HQW2]